MRWPGNYKVRIDTMTEKFAALDEMHKIKLSHVKVRPLLSNILAPT